MRKTFTLIFSIPLLLCGCSLNMSMTERISSLETRFEHIDSLSDEEAARLVEEYNLTVSKFKEKEDKFTEKDRNDVRQSIDLINGILMKKRMAELEIRFERIDLMSEEEVSSLIEEYKVMVSQFKEEVGGYSDKEKEAIYQSIGRINGILAKRNIDSSLKDIGDFLNSIPDIVEGFFDGLGNDSASGNDALTIQF